MPIISSRVISLPSPRPPARAEIVRDEIDGTGSRWRVIRGNQRGELAPDVRSHIGFFTSRRNARSRPRAARTSSRSVYDLVPANDTIVVVLVCTLTCLGRSTCFRMPYIAHELHYPVSWAGPGGS